MSLGHFIAFGLLVRLLYDASAGLRSDIGILIMPLSASMVSGCIGGKRRAAPN